MNILFLTIGRMESIDDYSLYPDLLRQFRKHGHDVYVVSAYERRVGKKTTRIEENGAHMLHVKIGNVTKCNIIEKGFSTILIGHQFKRAITTYFADVKFDLVLYSTPPITLAGVVQYIKKRDSATTYLLLKDIFPQNAVDIGLMKRTGVGGFLFWYFREKERKLYAISDRIGCMSEANCEFILHNNPEIAPPKVEVCPNAIEVRDMSLTVEERIEMRDKYGIPRDKTVFVYGGNLGKPQGIHFLIECLNRLKNNVDVFFLIVGSGTEYKKLEAYIKSEQPHNVCLMERMPKEDYDRMVAACDVGMIFLDHRFTIPNFPSRLLSYMQAGLPVLACTDPNTDIGNIIMDGGFGWWCESNDAAIFAEIVAKIDVEQATLLGKRARIYLQEHYTTEQAYRIIVQEGV